MLSVNIWVNIEYWIYWVNIYKSNCYGKSMRMNSVFENTFLFSYLGLWMMLIRHCRMQSHYTPVDRHYQQMPFSWKQMRLQLLHTHLTQLGSKYITFNNRILESELKKSISSICCSTDSCYALVSFELHSRSWDSQKKWNSDGIRGGLYSTNKNVCCWLLGHSWVGR